ncbi:MAG: DUF4922 domain-containing protein [Bacteroidota bacterium]
MSSLSELSLQLLEEQKKSWPQLAQGYASLSSVKLREIRCDGFSVFLQYNPGRIVSTGAKVDEKTIRERACFLCVPNLPPPQKAILYRGEFLVLCNPAPIFHQHLTISHINHIPQAIEPFVQTLLDLARDMSPRFTVFYNGPRCGASAPDHMHFQTNPTGMIPVENEAADDARRALKKKVNAVSLWSLERYGRQVTIFESDNKENLQTVLLSVIATLRKATRSTEEPMMNMLCSYRSSGWRVILFPRRRHRPDVYFKEGEEKVLISPAAVDIGGLVITPVEKDFNTVDATMIQDIFEEVSLERGNIEEVIASL